MTNLATHRMNGSKAPTADKPIAKSPNYSHICVACNTKCLFLATPQDPPIQDCPNCKNKTMLPRDTPEVDVLRVRVGFLEATSTQVIETLKGVIDRQQSEIDQLSNKED